MLLTALLVLFLLVALAVYAAWEFVEDKLLRPAFVRAMATELGTDVSLVKFRLRATGVCLQGLELANDKSEPWVSFEAPYCARVGSLQVKTSGILSLLSCCGTLKVGSTERKLVLGFLYRDIEEVVVDDVSIYVEEVDLTKGRVVTNHAFFTAQEERSKAKKRAAAKAEAKMVREFKNKWRSNEANDDDDDDVAATAAAEVRVGDEDDSFKARLSRVGETLRKNKGFAERRDALKDLRDKFKAVDKEKKEAVQISRRNKRDADHALWRIGRVEITRCKAKVKGHEMSVVDDWELRGFIGDTTKLKRKVVTSILHEMLGETAHKAIDRHVLEAKSKVANFKARLFHGGSHDKTEKATKPGAFAVDS